MVAQRGKLPGAPAEVLMMVRREVTLWKFHEIPRIRGRHKS
jgi:hypothetical protein